MRHERYLTPEGRVLYRAETNKHHAVWKKDWYRSVFEKQKFREMAGFVLPLSITAHRDLHANVEPPKKPNQRLMQGLYNYNRTVDVLDPYERFEHLTEFLGRLAMGSGNAANREDAYWLHNNFTQQLQFIEEGKLTPYYGEENGEILFGRRNHQI